MRNKVLTVSVMALAMLSTSCGKKQEKTEETTVVNETRENKLRRMPDYHINDEVTLGEHTYSYDIVREACDSLGIVTDDMGDRYADNFITVTLKKDGTEYFKHRFTKAFFRSSLDENFYKNSILDGIRLKKAEAGQGLTFYFTVSLPESDMTNPFALTVTDAGAISFVKDDSMDFMDDDYDQDGV